MLYNVVALFYFLVFLFWLLYGLRLDAEWRLTDCCRSVLLRYERRDHCHDRLHGDLSEYQHHGSRGSYLDLRVKQVDRLAWQHDQRSSLHLIRTERHHRPSGYAHALGPFLPHYRQFLLYTFEFHTYRLYVRNSRGY